MFGVDFGHLAGKGKCTCSCNGCNDGHHCGISRDGCEK